MKEPTFKPTVNIDDQIHPNPEQAYNNQVTENKEKEGGIESRVIGLLKTKDSFQIQKALTIIDEQIVDPEDMEFDRWGYYGESEFEKKINKFIQDLNGVNKFGEIEYALRDGHTKVNIRYRGRLDEWEIDIAGFDAFQSDAVKKWNEIK